MELIITMCILSFILGVVISALVLRIVELDAEQKLFDKQNSYGNITIEPGPKRSAALNTEQQWRNNIINNEGRN